MSNFSNFINFFLSINEGRLIYSPISFGILFFVFQFCIMTVPFSPLNKSGTDLQLDIAGLSKIDLFISFCLIGFNFFLCILTSATGFKYNLSTISLFIVFNLFNLNY